MKTSSQSILNDIAEANKLLDQGAREDAVLLSGEALALAYEQWATKINPKENSLEQINVMAIAASCHCGSLAAIGNFHDAYATAVGAILQISVDPNNSDNINQSLLSIYTTAVFALLNELASLVPDDNTRAHINCITRYLGSMLYHFYNLIGNKHPDSPYLEAAHEALSIMQNYTNIESPVITVLNEQIDPTSSQPLIGDLVGRSRALGLLAD